MEMNEGMNDRVFCCDALCGGFIEKCMEMDERCSFFKLLVYECFFFFCGVLCVKLLCMNE